jgi:hypothetical protein
MLCAQFSVHSDINCSLKGVLNANVDYTVADFFSNLVDDSQIKIARCIRELALI